MNIGDILGGLGSLVGIGSGVKNLIGGNQGGDKNSNAYIPTGLGAADDQFQQLLQLLQGSIGGAGAAITPELAKAFQALLGSGVGDQYNTLAGEAGGAGDFLRQLGLDVGGAGQQLWQTSLDPNNALRDTTQQRIVDASRAGTSARGIGMSPEAAGIENKAVSDFLMNWENERLGRQATGLQGYGNAANQAGRNVAGGLAAGAMAPEFTTAGASVPFQAAGQYTGALGGLNSQYGGILNNIIQYLNQGNAATGQGFTQGQVGLNNLTTGLGTAGDWLTKAFSSPATSSVPYGGYDPAFGAAGNYDYFQGGGR